MWHAPQLGQAWNFQTSICTLIRPNSKLLKSICIAVRPGLKIWKFDLDRNKAKLGRISLAFLPCTSVDQNIEYVINYFFPILIWNTLYIIYDHKSFPHFRKNPLICTFWAKYPWNGIGSRKLMSIYGPLTKTCQNCFSLINRIKKLSQIYINYKIDYFTWDKFFNFRK